MKPCGCIVVLMLVAAAAVADEPPIAGRPENFSGAVGTFRIRMEAQPTELLRDETLTLTVTITADGPFTAPPKRPDLRTIAAFSQAFHIEPLPEKPSNGPEWQFVYRLRPRDVKVDAVPNLTLVYFKPSKTPGAPGTFQYPTAPRIPITVKEPAPATVTEEPPPLKAPEAAYAIVESGAVLARPWSSPVPEWVLLIGALLAPPAMCMVWFLVWRRMYPEAAKLTQQRRSRAA